MSAEFRRVLRVQGMDSDANPRFQMVPNGGFRYVALHNGQDWRLGCSNESICSFQEVPENQVPATDRSMSGTAAMPGDRFFMLRGHARGDVMIAAVDPNSTETVFLEVAVKDKVTQHVQFYSVRDNAGHRSRRPLAVVGDWLPNLNYIWRRQANVEIVRHGSLGTLTVNRDLGDPIALPSGNIGTNGTAIRDAAGTTADLGVFFVWEIDEPGSSDEDAVCTIGTATNGGPGICIFEDQAGAGQMLSLAHEFGHHMGLDHNNASRSNLMWPYTGERGLNLTKEEVNIVNP